MTELRGYISMLSSLLLICLGSPSERNTDNAAFQQTNKFLVWFLHRLNYGLNIKKYVVSLRTRDNFQHYLKVMCLFVGKVSLGPEASILINT